MKLWGRSPRSISEVVLRSMLPCDHCNKSTRRRQLRGGNEPWRGSLRMCREADTHVVARPHSHQSCEVTNKNMRPGEILRRAARGQRSRFRQTPAVGDALVQETFTLLSVKIHRTYLEFRFASSQGGHGQSRSRLMEVSRGRSTASSHTTDNRKNRRERASTSSADLVRSCR